MNCWIFDIASHGLRLTPTMAVALFHLVLFSSSVVPGQSISSSKHNLSATSGNAIRAASEQQLCVFCHTPHSTVATSQLWNKQLSSVTTYNLYSSDYLTSIAYDSPVQINQKSKLCMSCHDGTIALGSVYNVPGTSAAGTISMTGGVTTMPTASPGYIGTDLTNDHPVGFTFNPAQDPELQSAPAWNSVKLDNGRIECHTCHDPHDNTNGSLLRMSQTDAGLCVFCHNKTNFTGSIHKTTSASYTPSGGTATTVGERSCRSCHKVHGGAGTPYLLTAVEQNTCYDGTNSGCHGSSATAANNVQSDMAKTYAHPTDLYTGRHKRRVTTETPSELSSTNRHAECQDCHNPHQAQQAVAKATRGTLRISAALKGTWGVQPTWPAVPTTMTNNDVTFATPTAYSVVTTPTDEYQLCLKCHSSYVTLSVGKRNIAEEINPNYPSYHGIVPGGATNTYVNSTTANEPWGTNKRVWCSDCHGSENAAAPNGPHGSSLTGVGPGTSNSDKLLVATIASSSAGTPLCLVCHKSTSYNPGSTGSRYGPHSQSAHRVAEGCFACHMWDYAAPLTGYTYGGNSGKINAHGWNKRWYYREGVEGSGQNRGKYVLTMGSGQAVEAFNGGYLADINYTTPQCWTETSNCAHGGGRTDNGWIAH